MVYHTGTLDGKILFKAAVHRVVLLLRLGAIKVMKQSRTAVKTIKYNSWWDQHIGKLWVETNQYSAATVEKEHMKKDNS